MAKQANRPRIIAIDEHGEQTRIKAERLEIQLDHGRSLHLRLLALPWGDLDIEASCEGDSASESRPAQLSLRSAAGKRLQLRVDVCHGAAGAMDADHVGGAAHPSSAGEAVAPDPGAATPAFRVRVTKALEAADKALAPKKNHFRRWAQAAVRRDVEVGIRLVGEVEGRELNRQYRGKDAPTNVLTFAYGAGEGERTARAAGSADDDALLEGDLVLCVPVVVREAAEQGKSVDAHFAHMVVHGMLHLQGYDHETVSQADEMESLEREILATLGYPDPYA